MSDAEFDRLAGVARDVGLPDRLDPRWERMADGTLSAEEEAALRREAGDPKEFDRLAALFTPPDPETTMREAEAFLAACAAKQQAAASPVSEVRRVAPDRVVTPLRPRRRLASIIAMAGTAAAACVLVLSQLWPIAPYQARWVRAPAVQLEAAEAGGGRPQLRAGDGGELEWSLSPGARVLRTVGIRIFATQGGGLLAMPHRVEPGEDGALRVIVPLAALPARGPRDVDFWIFVGPPWRLPADGEAARRMLDDPPLAVSVAHLGARLVGEAPR